MYAQFQVTSLKEVKMFENKYGTGALIPPEQSWKSGKTAGTVDFVTKCEEFLENGLMTEETALFLKKVVFLMKDGKLVLNDYLTIDDILSVSN